MSENRISKLERNVAQIEKDIGRLQATQRNQDAATVKKQHRPDQQSESASISGLIEGGPSNPDDTGNAAKGRKKWWTFFARIKWKLTLEIIGILAGIGYAAITYLQWRDSNRNFLVDERAWVLLDSLEYPVPFIPNQEFPVNSIVKNFGRTPALHVHSKLDFSMEGEVCRFHNIEVANGSNKTLGPGQEGHFSGTALHLGTPCLDAINSGTASLYVTGTVTYEDIFKCPHATHYHDKYNPNTHTFQASDDGNTAE